MICNTIGLTADSYQSIYVTGGAEIAEIYGGLNYSDLIFLKTQTMTGNAPFVFDSYPGGLTDYTILGNSYQNGVPDPDNPVEVVSCGERTENLIDASSPGQQRVELEPGKWYCLSKYTGSGSGGLPTVDVYDKSGERLFGDYINIWVSYSFECPARGKYAIISFTDLAKDKLSFVEGHAENNYVTYPDVNIHNYVIPVVMHSDNLFDATGYYKEGWFKNDSGIERTYDGAGYYTDYIEANPTKSITVLNAIGTYDLTLRLYFYDKDKNWIGRSNGYVGDFTVTPPTNCKFIQLQASIGLFDPESVMIVQGNNIPSEYIPYFFNTIPIYLSEPLRKIGDYADEIDFKTGTVVRRIGEHKFDGTEGFLKYGYYGYKLSTTDIFDVSHLYEWSHTVGIYCSIITGTTPYMTYTTNDGVSIQYTPRTSTSEMALVTHSDAVPKYDKDAFKYWLAQLYNAGTPVTIYYVLQTPTTEPITLPQIPTINGQNTLSIGTTLQPSEVSITGHIKPSSSYGNLTDVNGVYVHDKDGVQLKVIG